MAKKVKSPQGFARQQERKRLMQDKKLRQQIFYEETMKRGGYPSWEVEGFDSKGKPILKGPLAKSPAVMKILKRGIA